MLGEGWPDLVLRAVQCYRLELGQAQQASIRSQFRRELGQTLAEGRLPKALGELIRRRGGTPPWRSGSLIQRLLDDAHRGS